MIFYLKLFFLAINRKKTRAHYFKFQLFQAQKVVKNFIKFTTAQKRLNKSVIDFGCGEGAYALALSKYFKRVKAIDEFIDLKKNKHLYRNINIKLIKKPLLGYKDNCVDFIFCASVVEHIPKNNLPKFFSSLNLNLKMGGMLYLSFPPFLSPIGGHHTAPFHYLPDNIAFRLTYLFKKRKIISYNKMFGSWGLYKTDIKSVKENLVLNGFEVIKVQSRFMPKFYNFLFSNNNFFNWHCEIIAKKIK